VLNDVDRIRAAALTLGGKTPREAADMLDVSYSEVVKVSKVAAKVHAQGLLHEYFDLDEQMTAHILEDGAAASVPDSIIVNPLDMVESVEPVAQVLIQHDPDIKLEDALKKAAVRLTQRIHDQASGMLSVDECIIAAETLSKLQNAFFKETKDTSKQPKKLAFEQYLKD